MSTDPIDELAGHPGPLVFGEIHGTNEIPALVGSIVERARQRHRAVLLCLELPPGALDDRERHWIWTASHDGRSSTAMAALIDTALAHGATVTGIVPEHLTEEELARHEVHMADRLVAAVHAHPDALTVALVGNMHSRADAEGSVYATAPMAALASAELPTLRTVRFAFDGGTAWVMTDEHPSGGVVTLPAHPSGQRGLHWHDGLVEHHHATWAIGPVTASAPARRR